MKNRTLGKVISDLRKEHGMTQAQLAEQMNVTDKAVSKWERDLSCPDVNSLPKLAETLGVSVDELMQVKVDAGKNEAKETFEKIFPLVLKAVALAMGVGVIVLSALDEIEPTSAITMLGVGLACIAVSLLSGENNDG